MFRSQEPLGRSIPLAEGTSGACENGRPTSNHGRSRKSSDSAERGKELVRTLSAGFFQDTLTPYLSTLENFPVRAAAVQEQETDSRVTNRPSATKSVRQTSGTLAVPHTLPPEIVAKCERAVSVACAQRAYVDDDAQHEALQRMLIELSRKPHADPSAGNLRAIARFRLIDVWRQRARAERALQLAMEPFLDVQEFWESLHRKLDWIDLFDRFLPFVPLPSDAHRRVVLLCSCGWRPAVVGSLLNLKRYQVTRWFESGRRAFETATDAVPCLPRWTRQVFELHVADGLAVDDVSRCLDITNDSAAAELVVARDFIRDYVHARRRPSVSGRRSEYGVRQRAIKNRATNSRRPSISE